MLNDDGSRGCTARTSMFRVPRAHMSPLHGYLRYVAFRVLLVRKGAQPVRHGDSIRQLLLTARLWNGRIAAR